MLCGQLLMECLLILRNYDYLEWNVKGVQKMSIFKCDYVWKQLLIFTMYEFINRKGIKEHYMWINHIYFTVLRSIVFTDTFWWLLSLFIALIYLTIFFFIPSSSMSFISIFVFEWSLYFKMISYSFWFSKYTIISVHEDPYQDLKELQVFVGDLKIT